ncbi:MAG: hypothetical protein [Olavius algarvensis Delta 4 endosymbiont]|nr:MAG: hypothetical protein [Olavius algarvensis Delta 4 endosymbiont]
MFHYHLTEVPLGKLPAILPHVFFDIFFVFLRFDIRIRFDLEPVDVFKTASAFILKTNSNLSNDFG